MELITAPTEKNYDEMIFYLDKRTVQLTTKVKTLTVGRSHLYFNYEDEIVAITTPHERNIELTHKVDKETLSGLKKILGAGN